MKKNDVVTVEVTDIGIGGEGIGKVDGYTLFIKDAVIGDTVEVKVMKAKKNYGYARLMRIVKESAFRVSARCPEARRCGGCQIQEMDYRKQLEFKNTKVRNNLIRLGSVEEELLDQIMEPIAGMEEPFRYRNKAQFPIGVDKEGNLIAGFYAGRTHQIIPVPNRDCVLGVPENKVILDQILDYMREEKISAYDEERHKGLVRHVLVRYGFTTKEIMVCLIINGDKLPSSEKLLEKLIKIPGMTSITYNINKEKTNVIMGSKVCPLWGQTYITDYIGNVKYQISPLSFYQVNPVQTEVLYGTALEYAGLTGKETVWDVYCGIGTISLFLAQKAQKVYGVEIVPQAIEDAKHNAEINEITNAEFFVGKAEEVLPEYYADYAKEHPGELKASTNGNKASNHIGAQLLANSADFEYTDIPYGGTADQLLALRQGEVDFSVAKEADIASMTSEVKVLGVFSPERMESMPDVPTLGELGYYDQWYGSARAIVAPKGTPQEIIDFYADAFKQAMEDPEYVEAAEKAGVTTAYMNPAETQKLLDDQYTFCTDVTSKLWND